MSPELRSGARKQPTIQERALEDSPIVILTERTLSQPERVTSVAMKAGRVVNVWETVEPFEGEVVNDKEGK